MLLLWEINTKKYHYFDLYSIIGIYISIDLMVDKKTKIIVDNSLRILNTEYKKFPNIRNVELLQGKRLMLDSVLANSDHLINDPLNAFLDRDLLKQDIINLTETFIKYKVIEGVQRDQNDPKKCNSQTACTIVDDPLALDEILL